MFSLTFADLALAAIAGIIGAVIAERVTRRAQAVPFGLLLGMLVGVLVAQSLITSTAPEAVVAIPSSAPDVTRGSSSVATEPEPNPSDRSHVNQTAASPSAGVSPSSWEPTGDLLQWEVSALSSDAGDGDPRGPEPKLRFWHYEGTYGDVQVIGDYAIAPETLGADCGNPYVSYLVAGVPKGTYDVLVFTPDLPNLSTSVEYGAVNLGPPGQWSAVSFDQTQNRGQWVKLGTVPAYEILPGYYDLEVTVRQKWLDTEPGCGLTGRDVAFGPIRFIEVP